ncbi:MAG TPA: carboxypeptidase regulatory-like domain-containing protein [Pyrinomonadaceae bacterium]|nr:carboxypeptidase regulatory-like domain-containing protein [Pyrinomonadaceae bacterium]
MKKISVVILTILLGVSFVFSQSTSGRLVGTVNSPDGVLPNANVIIKDNKTGKSQTVVSGNDGGFLFPQLEFGSYTVTISATGFKTYVNNEVKVDVGREVNLNATLEVGNIQESVTVTGGADVLNSTTAELSTTVSPRQVLELPINGRNPLALLNLQAGVNVTSSSINGQRSSSANFTRDGINVQDNFIRTGGFVQDRPTVDDTGEFTVVTQNAGAELGNGGSTQVLLVTPRGGKDFHGALFAFNRNSAFAANTFGNNSSNTKRPFLNRNQFGGKASGPLPLPSFGEGTPVLLKDKGFFFVSYERFLLRQTAPLTRRVLLNQFRDGTFTYTATDGTVRTVNVLTGAGLTGAIPAASGGVLAVDPTIKARFLDKTPGVGNSTLQNGNLTQSYIFNQADNDTRTGLTTRFDVDINDKNNVYFVYKYNKNQDDRQSDGGGFFTTPFVTQGGPTDFYLGSYRTILGSSFVNESRVAYSSSKPFFNQSDSFPKDFVIGGLPLGLTSPEPSFQDQGRNTKQYTVQNNSTYSFDKHTFRFGLELNAQRIESITNFNQVPIYNISTTANTQTPRLAASLFPGGISTTDRGRADALRYLLGGIVGGGTVNANFVNPTQGPVIGAPLIQRFNYETWGLYVGDQWRLTPNLTVNLGLRWDYFTPLTNPDQVYLEPNLNGATTTAQINAALLNPAGQYVLVGKNSGVNGSFFKPDRNNFGPNVSFAYSSRDGEGVMGFLMGKNGVLRGGFRMGYINDEYIRSSDNAAGGNSGLNLTVAARNPATNTASLNSRFNNLPGFTLPAFTNPPISYATGNANAGNFFNTIFAIDPNLQMQRNMEYSFGLQREIGFDTVFEIRYVGGRSNNMVRGVDINQVEINKNGFLQDFINARNNCRIQGGGNLLACTNAANIGLPGQVNLPVFAQLPFGAFLNDPTVVGQIIGGAAADLAVTYLTNGLDQVNGVGVNFRPNYNGGPIDLLINGGRYRYNSMQTEIRRRFTNGFSFQANYTFQKILSDIGSDAQARFDPLLDNAQPGLEYSRPDYDRTHTVNINTIYELPFGKGKRFLNDGGTVNSILGGWQFASIINISSGPPISIRDRTGTLNRTARSARQSATTNLTNEQIKDLIGIFKVGDKTYFINPKVIAPDGTATGGNVLGTPTTFAGQVFFRNQPGQVGNLQRHFINGPMYFNWDASLIKNVRINETMRVQLRAEAFNVLNNVNFFVAESSNIFDINSTTFGQIGQGNTFSPRIMQFAVRFEF